MKQYTCSDCHTLYEVEADATVKCPQCGSSNNEPCQSNSLDDFDIEDLIRVQYGCKGGCSCS